MAKVANIANTAPHRASGAKQHLRRNSPAARFQRLLQNSLIVTDRYGDWKKGGTLMPRAAITKFGPVVAISPSARTPIPPASHRTGKLRPLAETVSTIAMATAKTAVAKKRFRRAAASNLRARRCKGYVSDQAHRCASRARKPTIGWTISSPAAARKGTHRKPASKRTFKGAVQDRKSTR